MKKIILLIVASLTFLIAEDVEIKSAGTNYNNGVIIKNSLDSVLVDIDGTGVLNIRGIPTAGATLRLFEAFGNGFSYLQLNPGVSLAENAIWNLSSAGGSGNMFLGFESGNAILSSGAANVGLGYNAAKALTSGVRNVAMGYKALTAGTSSNNNIAIGYQAGNVLVTGKKNIIIGSDADPSSAGGENQIVIGFESVGTADNQVVLGNSSTTQWVPGSADATDLGSASAEFDDLFLGDGSVVNLGVDQDVSLTHIADTGVRLNSASQLQFRDATLKVSSSADGQLDVDADTELELVAPIVDIDASTEVNVSSELKVGGKISVGTDGSAADVIFYSNTSGDDFTWDASEEKLIITGSNGQDALTVVDGNVTVADNVTAAAFVGDGSSLTGLTVSDITGDLTVKGEENNSGTLNLYADEGDDDNDKWRIQTANGGSMTIDSKQSESWSTLLTIGNTGNAALAGDLTVTGDDLTMATNTSGAALIGDGTNFNPVVISGDISVGANGAAAIGSGVIVNADVSSGAAITDSKLATISTANKVGLAALDIDGGTDIGAAIVDADLFIIDDGAGGTNRKVTASRIKTYAQSGVSSAADDITTGDAAVTIATSSGDITVDSPGDIVLDADGADIVFKDGGTVIGGFSNSLSDFVVTANVADMDMHFNGNDGGTTITALTFDMSNNGSALFRDNITVQNVYVNDALTVGANMGVKNGSTSGGAVAFYEDTDNGSNYTALMGASSISSDVIWTLPSSDGSSGQFLSTNGSGTLSWGSASFNVNTLSDALIENNSMWIGNDPSSTTDAAQYNLAVATTALDAITTGDHNVAVGNNSLTNNTTGSSNTGIGSLALQANISGSFNTAISTSALYLNTTGSNNVAVGYDALSANTTGSNNIALGYQSLLSTTTGNNNTAIGKYSLKSNTTAYHNTASGYQAGDIITTGTYNVMIGSNTDPSAADATNQIVIGQGATGQADNSVVLGNADVTAVYMAQDQGATTYGATFKGSTSLQTPLIEYTDGDDAITIADGGAITTAANLSVGGSNNELRFYEGSNYVGFEAPALSADKIWVLPTADGSANQVLKTDGSGTLSWTTLSSATDLDDLSDGLVENSSLWLGNDPSGSTNSAGNNIGIGTTTLDAITTGDNNVAVGYDALTANTTGEKNIAIGSGALDGPDTESNNLAIGYEAMSASIAGGEYNVAVGNSSLKALTSGDKNTGVGYNVLTALTTGSWNTAVGHEAGKAMTTGADNTAFGLSAGAAITTGSRNIAIGGVALDNVDTENDNLAIGYAALGGAIAGGEYNVAIGNYSLDATTSGDNNVAMGYNALTSNTVGSNNVALGHSAMFSNTGDAAAATDGSDNVAIGSNALYSMTEGYKNIAIGTDAYKDGTTGGRNIAIGYQSMENATSPWQNVAIGHEALKGDDTNGSTGGSNLAIGYQTLYKNTSGSSNTAVGFQNMYNNTTGYTNTAIGSYNMYANTEGYLNIAMGSSNLNANTTGDYNIGIGYAALYYQTTPSYNVGIGYEAGRYNTQGSNNVSLGYRAGYGSYNNSNYDGNTSIGSEALKSIRTGDNNTAVGYQAGDALRTGSNNTIIGYGAAAASNSTSNSVTLGNSSITSLRCATQSISSLSDARDKTNIEDLPIGLEFINTLRPRKFEWDTRDGAKVGITEGGFIAQELLEAEEGNEWLGLVYKENPEKLEASYGKLLPVLVKAVQELSEELEIQKREIAELKMENQKMSMARPSSAGLGGE